MKNVQWLENYIENALIVFIFARHISKEARSPGPAMSGSHNAIKWKNQRAGVLNSNLKVCDRQGKIAFQLTASMPPLKYYVVNGTSIIWIM